MAQAGPKHRGQSLTMGGEDFRKILLSVQNNYASGPRYIEDLEDFMNTFIKIANLGDSIIGKFHKSEDNNESKKPMYQPEIIENGIIYTNVGIIGGVISKDPKILIGHAVSYVRINTIWYKGDNEKGFLELRTNGPPTWETIYAPGWKMYMMYYFYVKKNILNTLPFSENLNNFGFHGKVSFKQSGNACWADSIQSILIHSDGYRNLFSTIYDAVFAEPDCRLILKLPPLYNESCKKIIEAGYIKNIILDDKLRYAIMNNIILKLSRLYRVDIRNKVILLLAVTIFRVLTWKPSNIYITHIQGPSGTYVIQPDTSVGAYQNNIQLERYVPTVKRVTSEVSGSISTNMNVNSGGYYKLEKNQENNKKLHHLTGHHLTRKKRSFKK